MQDRFKFRIFIKNEPNPKYNGMFKVHSLHLGTNKAIISSQYGNVSIKLDNNKALMQCTGLKDKNGKLIYEGDIVNVPCGNFVIKYCDNCKSFQCFYNDDCFACEGDYHWFELLDDLENLKVIGNIYENPELMGDNS